MKKRYLSLAMLLAPVAWAEEIPTECQTFLSEAEKMFKTIELDEKLMQAELKKYQQDMQNIDPIKLPRMCTEATEAIKEQLPDLEKEMEKIKALKTAK